jgi:predicted amidohydrolase
MLALLVTSGGLTWSQTSTEPPAQSGHDQAQAHAQHMEHMQSMCKQMMEEHVAEMKATSQTLATNLAQLKAMLPLINDINERSRWQSNIAMWQSLADHFKNMAQHAEHMQAAGMGCGMMMGHGMGDAHPPVPPAKQQ